MSEDGRSQEIEVDGVPLGTLLEANWARLHRMLSVRLDPRLQGRVDASDVVQETFLEATGRIEEYLRDRKMPFFLWLRFLAGQKLQTLRRRHLGTKARAADKEISIYQGAMPQASSACLAAQLVGKITTASQAIQRAELQIQLQEVLNGMDPVDREVLALRHFEHLDTSEVAQVLGITPSGASSRYLRALKRLKSILEQIPGFFDK